jgi:energy-coupling factor transporter ATP-binding protein EcfA2
MAKSAKTPDRLALLENLSKFAGGGVAESDAIRTEDRFCVNHLPIAEHRRVLDRDTLLVLGGRGAGKSQLFNILSKLKSPRDLLAPAKAKDETPSTDRYLAGFTCTGTTFPAPEVIAKLLAGGSAKTQQFWLGLLCGVLLENELTCGAVREHLDATIQQRLREQLSAPTQWIDMVTDNLESVRAALDRTDEALTRERRFLAITYDDLDILAAKVADVYPLVRELLAFWLRNSRRWTSLRCKIFLRTDIFTAEELAFTDSSKLRPLSVTLRWSAENLYRLVLKRLLNGEEGSGWATFIGSKIRKSRLKVCDPWGTIPDTDELDHRAFMGLIVGEWMGSDRRRGATYQWFLNHLQDSRGDIAPRSFLKLFESSAARQVHAGLPTTAHLISPEQISGALAEVSEDRILELKEEYGWIGEIGRKLKDQTVPMERGEFRKLIRGLNWEELPEILRNKSDRPDRLIDYLVSLGILRETADKRIHVPDIYLFGFGLKRKGGIRRLRV